MPQLLGLSRSERFWKRCFDLAAAFIGFALTWWLIVFTFAIATLDTRRNGFYIQERIGRNGKPFKMIKIRTMRDEPSVTTTVTTANDVRITSIGRFLRRTKLDELPQLMNVLLGQMSFVGPRPDVAGFADQLKGDDRVILTVSPGIIGPGTLKYLYEEELLARQADAEKYNREVVFPDKVKMNRDYIENYSFFSDLKYLYQTFTRLRYHRR